MMGISEVEMIKIIIKKMKEEKKLDDKVFDIYISQKLKLKEIADIYKLIDEENLILILNSVANNYEDVESVDLLSLGNAIGPKGLASNPIVILFCEAICQEKKQIFTNACELWI